MNNNILELLSKYRIDSNSFTQPLMSLDLDRLGADIATFKEEGLSMGFIRRRIVFFMDGYRYALRAAEKRWGIEFGFYETGKDPVKKVYFSGKFNDRVTKVWLQRIKEDENFSRDLVEELKTIIEMEKYLAGSIDPGNLSKEQLALHLENHFSWWVQFFELAFPWFCVEDIRQDTDRLVKESWKGTPDSLSLFLDSIYRPMDLPVSSVEQRDLLAVCQLAGAELDAAIDLHWQKYRHLSLHNIDDEPFDKDYYSSRIKLLRSEDEYQKQKGVLALADKEIELANSLLKEVDLSQEIKSRIEFVRWFMFLRTESVDNMMLVNASYRHVFDALSKIFDLPTEAVLNMTYKEIFDGLREGSLVVKKETVLDRLHNGYAYYIGHKTEALLTGKDRQALIDLLHPQTEVVAVKEFKGQIAYKGKVKAVARVILDRKNASELKEGEILVTAMTAPDFVPAMKLSAGIITNEGGVLCHAAIMSRELQKPCVIGTKNATDVIKTGDLVELDADVGLIKIL